MEFSQAFSVEPLKLLNNADFAFESDDNDFDAVIALECDEDLNAGSTIVTRLETTLVSDDKNVVVVDDEAPLYRKNITSPADYNADVVFESDAEELEEETLLLPHLRRIHNDASLYCRDDLAITVSHQKSKSVFLETTIPPATTTTDEIPKEQIFFCAKTKAECGRNASVALFLGRGRSYCKLRTIISNADCHGIYWCPFPKCRKKSRKKFLLKDHLRKSHHGPFYCTQCGIYFLQLPSLNRHFRQTTHSKQNDVVGKETIRRHTVAAVERFSVCMYKAFAASSHYILS